MRSRVPGIPEARDAALSPVGFPRHHGQRAADRQSGRDQRPTVTGAIPALWSSRLEAARDPPSGVGDVSPLAFRRLRVTPGPRSAAPAAPAISVAVGGAAIPSHRPTDAGWQHEVGSFRGTRHAAGR